MEEIQRMDCPIWPDHEFKIGSRTIILLGTHDVVRDLFVKRAKIYSSRPRFIAIGEYHLKSMSPVLMPYGERWLGINRAVTGVINPQTARDMMPLQLSAAHQLSFQLLQGGSLDDHLSESVRGVFETAFYGTDLPSELQSTVQETKATQEILMRLICLENGLVDLFPALEYVPGVSWVLKRKGDAFAKAMLERYTRKMEFAIQSDSWNMTREIYERRPANMSWEGFACMVGEAEIVSNFTTPTILGVFATMAAGYPHEMQQVQAEIDKHIGSERLPTFADLSQLPYTHAFFNECSRLAPIFPLGGIRAVSQEDEYMGYRIPQDVMILPFLWGINMDESVYPDPTSFQPQRWIDNPNLPLPDTFGHGKRLCPGKPIAERMILIDIACIAWGYDFTADDDFDYQAQKTYSLFNIPSTSAVHFSCRSPAHRATIERVHREAQT